MKIFEGKTKEERNKIIIAAVLGLLALLAVGNMLFSPFSGSKKTTTASTSPTPSPTPKGTGDIVVTPLPQQSEIDSVYSSIPVSVQYPPAAPDAGRNIFAFFEPPIPTPKPPTPTPEVKTPDLPTPIPPPTPNVLLSSISKQMVFAGEPGFKLQVGGDKFTPDLQIWFGGMPLPTKFESAQMLSTDIPANYLTVAGARNVEVKTADNKFFSNVVAFMVQQPPLPQFQYLGIVSRKRGNNDMAYIMEQGKTVPSNVRLNDVIGGRFRLVSIAPRRLLVKDINLGFLAPYPIELVTAGGSSSSSPTTQPPYNPNNPNPVFPNQPFPNQPFPNAPQNPNPTMIGPNGQPCPPGIPCGTLRQYQTPKPNPNQKDDVDDDDPEDTDQ